MQLASYEPTAIIASPCHGRRVRIPAQRGALDVKCPEPGCGRKWRWMPDDMRVPSSVIETRPQIITRHDHEHALTRGMPMLKVEYGEMQIRCSKTGLQWSAAFEKRGNAEKFAFVAAREGKDIALELLFARISGSPEFRATRPTRHSFKRDELLFLNAKCPGCGFTCRPGWTVLHCSSCDSYVCHGNTRQEDDVFVSVCHPQCPSHPDELHLVKGSDEVDGYHMRVYRLQ